MILLYLDTVPSYYYQVTFCISHYLFLSKEILTLAHYFQILTPQLTKLQVTQFKTYVIFKNKNKKLKYHCCKAHSLLVCGDESTMRWRWLKDTVGWYYRRWDGYNVANQVPVCWNLDFNLTLLCKHMYRSWPYIHSILTNTKFNLDQTFWNSTTS